MTSSLRIRTSSAPSPSAGRGRTAGRQPSSDPAEVIAVKGNQLTVRFKDGKVLDTLHTEDAVVIPSGSRNFETDDGDEPFFDNELDAPPESSEVRRSPGMMIEDKGKAVKEARKATPSWFWERAACDNATEWMAWRLRGGFVHGHRRRPHHHSPP